jgi:hypothetical protein
LSVGSSVLATSPSQAHLARVSTLSSPDTWSGIRPVIHDAPAEEPVTTRRGFPVPFGLRHWLLGPSQSRSGSSAFLTVGLPDNDSSGPRRGYHVPHARDTTGEGASYIPGTTVLSRPSAVLDRRLPLSNGQPLPPANHYPSTGPALRDINEGSRDSPVRPAPDPCPRMEREALRRFPELRTPPLPAAHVRAGPGIEHAPGTHTAESRFGPPICEFTRIV